MIQRLFDRDALQGVDDEHFAEEIARRIGRQLALGSIFREENVWEESLDRVARIPGSILNIVAYCCLQTVHELSRGRAELFDDLVPLINV